MHLLRVELSNKPPIVWLYPESLVPVTQQGAGRKMHPSKNLLGDASPTKLSSILAEIVHPLHYGGWKQPATFPRCFKLNLTNFQAELNKQSRVLIVRVLFSLSEPHGRPLSHKLQCCGGTVMSSRIVKMTLMLHAWRKPNYPGLCLCQSLLMRERLVGMLQNCWVYNDWHRLCFFFLSRAQSKNVC